jgi:CRISPR-associated protein Cmr2
VTSDALDYKGAGLFPDRLIFESKKGDYELLEKAKNDAIKAFTSYFKENNSEVEVYLKQYLRIAYFEKEPEKAENIIHELYQHLDTLELQSIPLDQQQANNDFLFKFFRDVNNSPFFKDNCYGEKDNVVNALKLLDVNENKRFESLVEIATREFKNENEIIDRDTKDKLDYKTLVNRFLWDDKGDNDNDQMFIETLKSGLPKKFKNYHKYVAIIKADGDKVGSTIKNMKGNISTVKEFSKDLLAWAMETDLEARKFGAIPIYIGGDDLLLFSPVAIGDKTIIDLIEKIDELFVNRFKKYKNKDNENPTLSYGVAVHYYKYPLYESVECVDTLLQEAKSYAEKRNSICIRVLKHSGSELKSVFTKSGNITKDKFQSVLDHLKLESFEKNKSFLSSVAYTLRDNEEVINVLHQSARSVIISESQSIEHFFKNNYDDYKYDPEERNAKGKYLFAVKELLLAELKDAEEHKSYHLENYPDDIKMRKTPDAFMALQQVYSALKISRFIKGLDDEK